MFSVRKKLNKDQQIQEIVQKSDKNIKISEMILESQLQQIYYCSCGKQYKSFPATYLHFRDKHDIRLSTKSDQRRKSVQIEGYVKKITYALQLKDDSRQINNIEEHNFQIQHNFYTKQYGFKARSQDLKPEVKDIQVCIQKYLKSKRQQVKALYQNLLLYLNSGKFEGLNARFLVNLSMIPHFLNDFVLQYLPVHNKQLEKGSSKWQDSCKELKQFCDWLKSQKYTQLLVVYQHL